MCLVSIRHSWIDGWMRVQCHLCTSKFPIHVQMDTNTAQVTQGEITESNISSNESQPAAGITLETASLDQTIMLPLH